MAETSSTCLSVPRLPLIHAGSNMSIPQIGLGTYLINTFQVISTAVSLGYRLFDSAVMYGNESEIGQALEKVYHNSIDYVIN